MVQKLMLATGLAADRARILTSDLIRASSNIERFKILTQHMEAKAAGDFLRLYDFTPRPRPGR
jgi:hypothetical protein